MASRDNNLLAQLEWEDDDNDPDYVDAEEGDEEEYELEEMDVDIDEQAPEENEDDDPLTDERIDAMGSVNETLNMLRQGLLYSPYCPARAEISRCSSCSIRLRHSPTACRL